MGLGTCHLGIESLPGYSALQEKAKKILRGAFNSDAFNAIMQAYYDKNNSLPKSSWIQQHLREFKEKAESFRKAEEGKNLNLGNESPKPINISRKSGYWTRTEAYNNKDVLYVFTDNTDRDSGDQIISNDSWYAKKYGKGHHYPKRQTQAVLRGLDNARPISTQRWYHEGAKYKKGQWTDADAEEFEKVIDSELKDILEAWNTGKYKTIMFGSGDGVFNGSISEITKRRTPELYRILSDKFEEYGFGELIPQDTDVVKPNTRAYWARAVEDGQGFEVSEQGDELGKKFSPLRAILPENTIYTWGRGRNKRSIDLSGYSIEAAFAIMKGYDQLGNKTPDSIDKVIGYGKEPLRGSALYFLSDRENQMYAKYLWLWEAFAQANPKLMEQLRDATAGGELVLTDTYAGRRNKRNKINQARALSEILYGKPETELDIKNKAKYEKQMQQINDAADEIVKNLNPLVNGVKVVQSTEYDVLKEVVREAKHLDENGRKMKDAGGAYLPNGIITFAVPGNIPHIERKDSMFINPFKGEDAVKKFIMWLIPNNREALPEELRKANNSLREKLREQFLQGHFKRSTIFIDSKDKNGALYAAALRYMANNFKELRQVYNPLSDDIQNWGIAKQGVIVSDPYKKPGEHPNSGTMKLYVKEDASNTAVLDNDGLPTRYFEITQQVDASGNPIKKFYVEPSDDALTSLTDSQKLRIYKTIAAAIPIGAELTVKDLDNQDSVSVLNKITQYGFKESDTDGPLVFSRVTDGKEMVVTQMKEFTRSDVQEDTERYYLFGDNSLRASRARDAIEKYSDKKDAQSQDALASILGDLYRGDSNAHGEGQAGIGSFYNAIGIPIVKDKSKTDDSYFSDTDDDFAEFKAGVDRAMDRAKEAIKNGYQIVIPREGFIGEVDLKKRAPKCYKYLKQQIQALRDDGNKAYRAALERGKLSSNVAILEKAPVEAERALDKSVAESPHVRIHQIFPDSTVLDDAIETVVAEFTFIVQDIVDEELWDVDEQIKALDTNNPEEKRERDLLVAKKFELQDPYKSMQIAASKINQQKKTIVDQLCERFANVGEEDPLWAKCAEPDIMNVLIQYGSSLIEERTGMKVVIVKKKITAKKAETDFEKGDNQDDEEGKRATGNDGWSFNVRLNDPYKSLSANVRRVISNLKMRDPNNPRKVLYNSFGSIRMWNSRYIYTSLMSYMAANLRGNADNFMTITPYEQLSEKDKQAFPIGKPSFPLLEKMKLKYIWAQDLIDELTGDFSRDTNDISEEEKYELGNVASQLYANFSQQFISYYIMKDGNLYNENYATGEQSLKDATIKNYEGGIMLLGNDKKPLPMIYNPNQQINKINVQKALEKQKELEEKWRNIRTSHTNALYSSKKGESEIKYYWTQFKKEHKIDNPYDAYKELTQDFRDFFVEVSDFVKCMGINITPYDVFCIEMSGEKDVDIANLLIQANKVLLFVNKHLNEDDHLIQSGKGMTANGFDSVETQWNYFFKAFGEYVSDREYQSSFHAKDGTTRYSYSASSFMSILLSNITNLDVEQRRAFIDENFKPYATFWDSKHNRWRNRILEALYNDTGEITSTGHDVISIFKGGKNIEFSNWSPQDIEDLMMQEYFRGSFNKNSAGMFIIPILSDKECCKVVEGVKGEPADAAEIVLQEYDRIKLCRERKKLLALQQAYFDNPDSLNERQKKYLSEHQAILNISNFDKHGKKFCFMPELNKLRFYEKRDGNDTFRSYVAQFINIAKGVTDASVVSYTLEDVFKRIENMDVKVLEATLEEVPFDFDRTGILEWEQEKGITLTTKERLMRHIAAVCYSNEIYTKYQKWAYDNGKMRESLVNSICGANSDIAKLRSKLPAKDPNGNYSKEEQEKIDAFNRALEDAAYGYYYDYAFSISQFIQVMTTDVAFYDGSNDFSKRWFSIYGAGTKLNTNSKFGKKTENYIILKDSARRSRSFEVFDLALQQAVKEGRISNIDREVILNKFKSIKGTDAQALRGLTSYKCVMDMAGRWTGELETCMQNLKSGKWDMSDFNKVYQTLKPFTFSNESVDSGFGEQLRVPTIHKNSEAVLLAIYATIVGSHKPEPGKKGDINYSARIQGINMAMEDEDMYLRDDNGDPVTDLMGNKVMAIDLIQYQSATKIGSQGVIDINYSRNKLEKAKEDSKVTFTDSKGVTVSETVYIKDTYDDIVRRLNAKIDKNEITEEQYNGLLDFFEPTAEEVKDIIKKSIIFDGTIYGCMQNKGYYNRQILHSVPYSDYCIQQPTPNHYIDNDKGVFGSQIRHIILSDIPDTNPDGTPWTITINGKTYSRDGIRKHYNDLIIANLLECFENDLESIFDVSDKRPPIYKLRDRLLNIVHDNPKYGKEMEQALEIIPDPETGKPTFALPLNNTNITVKLEEIMTSMFKNSVTRQKIKGGNAILAADIGYANSLKVIGERDKDGKLIPGKIKGIECLLPAQARALYEPFLLEHKDEKGEKYWTLDEKELHKAGLDEGIGYRIPTEGHYSIMPLIIKGFLPQQNGSQIVIAQEVVTLTGSDNDVDKEYLFLKGFTINEKTGKVEVVKFDPNVDMRKQSKVARDNEIIDIMRGILTHPAMASRWIHPGNFDTLKLNAQRNRILENDYLFNKYMQVFHFKTAEEALDDLKGRNVSKEAHLKKILKFMEDYEEEYSPIYPDTFTHYHQQNMAGVAEKGIFANNTTGHTKLQWVNIELTPMHQFTLEGRRIKRIDDRYIHKKIGDREVLEYVSDACMECSAASVDNAKDPQLAYLNCTIKSAPLFGFLLRAGFDMEEASLLFKQPYINYMIKEGETLKSWKITGKGGVLEEIAAVLKDMEIDVNTDPECDWREHNFTRDEWYENIRFGRFALYNAEKKNEGYNYTRNKNILKSLYRTYSLFADLIDAQNDFADAVRPLTADSPTHAIATSFAGMVLQTKHVENNNNRKYRDPDSQFFTGLDDLLVYQIDKEKGEEEGSAKYSNFQDMRNISHEGRNDALFKKLSESKLPITQAFYTLGIEKARDMFRHNFMFGRPEIQELTDMICALMDSRGIWGKEDRERILSQAYKDFITFELSGSPIFGSDEDGTFDEKRQYYLYKYPEEFLLEKAKHPELNGFECISRMTVKNGMIILNRQGQLTTEERDKIIDSFEALIRSDNPAAHKMATSLFIYTYYLNGFDFHFMSFGNLLGTDFLLFFPSYIKTLREMQTKPITEIDIERFFIQLQLKRNDEGLLEDIPYSDKTSSREQTLQEGYFNSGRNLEWYGESLDSVPRFITVDKKEIYQFSEEMSLKNGSLYFIPLRQVTSLHYNKEQSIEEMHAAVYDEDLIRKNRMLGSKKISADAYQREQIAYNNMERLIEMADHNSYSSLDKAERVLPSTTGEAGERVLPNISGEASEVYDLTAVKDMEVYEGLTDEQKQQVAQQKSIRSNVERGDDVMFMQNNADIVAANDEDTIVKLRQEAINTEQIDKPTCTSMGK